MKRKADFAISLVCVVVLGILLGYYFEYFYDMNDDVLIKDILSGAYSGAPSAMNNQNLWLIGALVSLLYRINRVIPWYGIILLSLQYGSLFIIVERTLKLAKPRKLWLKIMTAVSETLFLMSVMLSHLFNLQYTLTVAFMAGAAIMWLIASDSRGGAAAFIRKNIPTIIILFFAFNLRSEMLLLMLPFVCVAGFLKWSFEAKIFTKANIIKYLGTLGLIAVTLTLALIVDSIAYSSDGWKRFRNFFDARTELYDFQSIPPYEGNESFYEGIGLSKEEQILFENYNFGIDEEIDEEKLWAVAQYADGFNPKNTNTLDTLKANLKLYIYQLTHGEGPGSDYPRNLIGAVLYIIAVMMLLFSGKKAGFVDLLLLFAGRSAIWMYMLMGGRMPDRITHSLYFVEICVLIGLIALLSGKHKGHTLILNAGMALLLAAVALPSECRNLTSDQELRREIEQRYTSLYEYVEANPESYYLMDVYSSVDGTESVFGPMCRLSKKNIDILGGWICNSPLQEQKEAAYGISNLESALLEESVFFIKDKEQSMDWLGEYYESKGISIDIQEKDSLADGEFLVYEATRR